jgi:hypothetical protein
MIPPLHPLKYPSPGLAGVQNGPIRPGAAMEPSRR